MPLPSWLNSSRESFISISGTLAGCAAVVSSPPCVTADTSAVSRASGRVTPAVTQAASKVLSATTARINHSEGWASVFFSTAHRPSGRLALWQTRYR